MVGVVVAVTVAVAPPDVTTTVVSTVDVAVPPLPVTYTTSGWLSMV